MNFSDIIANELLTGDGYIEIKATDKAVRLTDVSLTQIIFGLYHPGIKNEVANGIYLVGLDIKPGTYQVEVTDNALSMGYLARLSGVSMEMNDIIANELLQGPGYVKILESDFAVKVQDAKLTWIE